MDTEKNTGKNKHLIGRKVKFYSGAIGVVREASTNKITIKFSNSDELKVYDYPPKFTKSRKPQRRYQEYYITDEVIETKDHLAFSEYPEISELFDYFINLSPGIEIPLKKVLEKLTCQKIGTIQLNQVKEMLSEKGKKLVYTNNCFRIFSQNKSEIQINQLYNLNNDTYNSYKTEETKQDDRTYHYEYPIRPNEYNDYRKSKYYSETIEDNGTLVYSKFTLFVYRNLTRIRCNDGNPHKEINVTLQTRNFRGYLIKLNVFYCKCCGKYYADSTTVFNAQLLYGSSMFYIKNDTWGNSYLDNYRYYESELTYFGYNVRIDGPSERERRDLLSSIIRNDFVSKQRCLSILQNNISFNGKNPNNAEALQKWKSDYDYVSKLEIDNQSKIKAPVVTILMDNKKYI